MNKLKYKNAIITAIVMGMGHTLMHTQPDACCGAFDACEEVGVASFVSGGDGRAMLEF